jgi:hypothetical protein
MYMTTGMQLYKLCFFTLGEYHKYDSIAYPKNTKISKSFAKSVKEHAYGFLSLVSGGYFGRGKEKGEAEEIPEDFAPLSHQEMSEFCLECYLLRVKEMLCSGSFPDGQDINSVALEIAFIFNSLSTECVSFSSDPTTRVRPQHRQVDGTNFKTVSCLCFYDLPPTCMLHSCVIEYHIRLIRRCSRVVAALK